MLRATGMDDKNFEGPIIAVFNTWTNMGPCNMDLDKLAVPVRAGIRAAGGTPVDFNSIAVSDGITMGSEGMRASLMSREVIADSIELAVKGHSLDGVIKGCLPWCRGLWRSIYSKLYGYGYDISWFITNGC